MSRIIKRYDNRKLYDTESRKYISLEEIAGLVRDGVDVKVIEQSTEKDITTQTLTQVIFEEGKKGRNPLSTEVLHDVIRMGNHMLDDGFQEVKKRIDQFIPEGLSLNKLFNSGESEEMDGLKKRIESLESLITNLANSQKGDDKKDS
ncbi:MAG: polyhydroxyalkanoate synthesis regulator DNA-binding domain-containing protein [Calditrichia bacterium]